MPPLPPPPPGGIERDGMVYELFVSTLPSPAFTSSDVLDLSLHPGAFETVLADEDVEQDPDRWCSHSLCGQEFWQILCQWVSPLRLELGQKLSPSDLRTTEFAKAEVCEPAPVVEPIPSEKQMSLAKYGPPQWARPSFTYGAPLSAFTWQPDGTLRCPADRPLYPQERRACAQWLHCNCRVGAHFSLYATDRARSRCISSCASAA